MTKKDRKVLESLVTQVADLAGCVATLQKLATQHHDAIKILQQPLKDPSRVQSAL